MLAKILTGALHGVDSVLIDVEVDVAPGIPRFDIVGLPDSAVKESKERVYTAIRNSRFEFPAKKITLNLAPADVRKEGSSYDLPIALGIIACIEPRLINRISGVFAAGELSLDGTIRPVGGILPMVYSAKKQGITEFYVPKENAEEASLVEDAQIYPTENISSLVSHLLGTKTITPTANDARARFDNARVVNFLDFADVKGQDGVKRALTIAAAGMHNILMVGPPGSGKTMMAKRLPTILPKLTFEESIDCMKIYSVSGELARQGELIRLRPFRSPHHTLSQSAMTGGGKYPRPGEISLAHNGVLFLDELPEFQKTTLEALRQPMEDGIVTIARVNGTVRYPSNFMLAASMNPCPCGFFGVDGKCTCSPAEVLRYTNKISGPLLDRIDLIVDAPKVEYERLRDISPTSETSQKIRETVERTRLIQSERYKNENILFNSQLLPSQVEKFCQINDKAAAILKRAFDRLGFSARAYHKILKVARTIADIDAIENITEIQITEALNCRALDRAKHI